MQCVFNTLQSFSSFLDNTLHVIRFWLVESQAHGTRKKNYVFNISIEQIKNCLHTKAVFKII